MSAHHSGESTLNLDLAGLHGVLLNVADERLANAHALHGFQITRDALFRDIIADPIPIAPWLGLLRRFAKAIRQWISRSGGKAGKGRDEEK